MKKLEIKPHTIIMTIGPSNCGKTYFCENHLIPFFESHNIAHKYFSSDKIRQQLLNEKLHKHNSKMMTVSKQAFSLLDSGVDNYTQYPVNTCAIVVDATHLSKMGRKNIIGIAKKNHYSLIGLVFDYKDRGDYFKYVQEGTDRRIISDMVKNLKESTMKELETDSFESIIRIDSNDFSRIEISFEDKNNYAKISSDIEQIAYVGDIHGCFDELMHCLLDDKGIEYDALTNVLRINDRNKYVHHILVGDLIDKGPKIKDVIELVYDNSTFFTMVKGNHEYWVYEYLQGRLKPSPINDELIATYFNTVEILQKDKVLREKFFAIYAQMKDFVLTDHSIVTHAPCENKYLAKSDRLSLKFQRNMRYPKRVDFATEEEYLVAKEKAFDFLLKDGDHILPFHIFGHTMLKDAFVARNKYCLDTGCVAGGYLSTALYKKGQRKLFIKKYPSRQPKTEVLGSYFRTKENEVSFSSLESDLQKRVRWAAEHKLNFISGTMSPCDKFEGDLESLKWGLEYYKSKGIGRVILQPKYMGSRANIFLHKTDVSKCQAFSRQGFLIKETRITSTKTMETLFKELQTKYAYIFEQMKSEEILFDGELLPWTSMGKDLIERDFKTITKGLSSEVELLKENGFDVQWNKLIERANDLVVGDETAIFKSSEKKNVLKVAEEVQSLSQMQEVLDKYTYQVELFGADAELEFRPFSILKTKNGEIFEFNQIASNSSNIHLFNTLAGTDSIYAVVDFKDGIDNCMIHTHGQPGVEGAVEVFWKYITQKKEMEGVVIKPEFAYVPDVAPYIKCRNKEYLRITYGQDYQSLEKKKVKLFKNKNIKRKLETSIKEWELGRKLLDIKRDEISIDNKKWVGLIVQLMKEQEGESTLDPRL